MQNDQMFCFIAVIIFVLWVCFYEHFGSLRTLLLEMGTLTTEKSWLVLNVDLGCQADIVRFL